MEKKISLSQTVAGIIIVLALFALGMYVGKLNAKMPMFLLAGFGLGYALTRSRYGFAGGVKRIYIRGEGSLTKAIFVLLIITAIIFMGVQWKAQAGGAVPAYLAQQGEKIIPGTQNVYFTNLATIIGGFIFGVGMMLAGGCGSGTLSDFGEGQGRAFIAFIFFVLFAAPGHWARQVFDRTAVGKIGYRLHIPQAIGYVPALIITILLIGLMYWGVLRYEAYRKRTGTYKDPKGDYEDFEQPLPDTLPRTLFSYATYHKLFVERWSFMVGTFVLAAFAVFVMVTTNKPWGVSSPLVTLDVAILQKLGITFSPENFGGILKKVNGGLLADGGTVRNIGTFFGCMVAFLLANRFNVDFNFRFTDACYYAVGGAMLGFGSRFAYGCNIGAMYSAITSFSFSGWIFLISMALGGVAGMLVFAGKVNILPKLNLRCQIEQNRTQAQKK